MPPFDLREFLERTGFSLPRLATYLQVAPTYLEAAAAGAVRLTIRDQAKCRLLWRRLFRGKQLELPFVEPLATFTRGHARAIARANAAALPGKPRAPHPAGMRTKIARQGPEARTPSRAIPDHRVDD